MVVPILWHWLYAGIYGTTIDCTICTHTTHKLIGPGLNRNCTGNPLTS